MEELDVAALLKLFEDGQYSILERVLLSHHGPVQTVLSVIWGEPLQVHVVSQEDSQDKDRPAIIRLIDMCTDHLVVMRARSRIFTRECSPQVVEFVRQKQLGLGQIATRLGIPITRHILKIGKTKDVFWREYDMRGDGLHYVIQEYLPIALYHGLVESWWSGLR